MEEHNEEFSDIESGLNTTVSLIEDYLESQMVHLPNRKNTLNRIYLAGCIDTFAHFGVISEKQRQTLYLNYAS